MPNDRSISHISCWHSSSPIAEDLGHTEPQVLAKQCYYEREIAIRYVDHPGYLAYYAAAMLGQG